MRFSFYWIGKAIGYWYYLPGKDKWTTLIFRRCLYAKADNQAKNTSTKRESIETMSATTSATPWESSWEREALPHAMCYMIRWRG